MVGTLLLIIITLFIPPIGVFLIAGCGMDLFINILLTILGYLPGHVHAFYLIYVYYKRKEQMKNGTYDGSLAPGVYSDRVQRGGKHAQAAPPPQNAVPAPPPGQSYGTV